MSDILQWNPCELPPPQPEAEDLHLWCMDLLKLPTNDSHLSDDERKRMTRFHSSVERRRFCAARGYLRRILAGYLDCSSCDVHFGYGEKGKPVILQPETDLDFNLTHCGGFALLAVTRGHPVGIDLEQLSARPNARRIARRVFDGDTLRQLDRVPDKDFLQAFLSQWTLLEARVKARGLGVFDRGDAKHEIDARNFTPFPGWIAAVAMPHSLPDCSKWASFIPACTST